MLCLKATKKGKMIKWKCLTGWWENKENDGNFDAINSEEAIFQTLYVSKWKNIGKDISL